MVEDISREFDHLLDTFQHYQNMKTQKENLFNWEKHYKRSRVELEKAFNNYMKSQGYVKEDVI